MIEINEELRELYRNDYFPARESALKKELKLYFPELGRTITTENVYAESMRLNESICSETDLTFGGCEAAQFEITVAGVGDEVIGKKMIVTQTVDDRFDMTLGTYIVKSAKKKDGMDFKEVLAYDRMTESDVDVSGWYNDLQFPMTIRDFRLSLCTRLGFSYEVQDLPNDAVVIQKTIEPSYLKGRDVLKAIGEANGMFGHFTRQDKFKYIGLGGLGLYPSETLYPAEDLYPSEPGEYITGAGYKSVRYEDYIVEAIDSLQIRQEEGDVGIVVGGTANNPYVIQGNFLCYGMDTETLKTVADNIFLNIKNKYYRPHTTTLKGLPYLEVGDSVAVIMGEDVVESFIFNRTLSGIQSLTDEYSATGNQTRKNEVSPSVEIKQLKGKTLRIDKSVEGLTVELSNLEENTSSRFAQTAESISTEVTRASQAESRIEQKADSVQINVNNLAENTNSQFQQTAQAITAKVSKGEVSSQISLESGKVEINSNRLIVKSTDFELDGNGNAKFRGEADGAIISGRGTINLKDMDTGQLYGCLTRNQDDEDGSLLLFAYGFQSAAIMGNFKVFSKLFANRITTKDKYGNLGPIDGGDITGKSLTVNGTSYMRKTIPSDDNTYLLGQASYRWQAVWAATGTISTSDRNKKKNICYDLDKYAELFELLQPCSFLLIDGTSGRTHIGFISQDVEAAMHKVGLTDLEFAGFCKDIEYPLDDKGNEDKTKEPVEYYSLRYQEFIAINTYILQKQRKEIGALKRELSELKESLKAKGVI